MMNIQKATFGNGCFWCTEAIFQSIKGVLKVQSGYMGGCKPSPTYMEVCNGDTGYAEMIKLEYDADVIGYTELLLMFFKTHNPTTLNRQGSDAGTQYRSVIFYNTDEQKQHAEAMIKKLTAEQVFDKPITTQVSPAGEFYVAETHHQNYYLANKMKPYCMFVIQPKMYKFAKEFGEKMKPEYF
ncbi:peptide-methionine (S)-S-oxide reductase [Mucilaginibacter gracilis]|uniref:Peptide methionine sulfoxide reductase MsrA n=1 Tax=Mucilaginibacter gracilis TaxID=423350 RepID=A0A495J7X0_9SPHI|nr:peptide-methionine (S)-S-oxide reductase MsrA [Mucilaginibacter gracilis]RKR85090.1 peptide-methionine (S)-S-oxide reductase [Mucilaginibacter gracilis]